MKYYYQDPRTGTLLPIQPKWKDERPREYLCLGDRWVIFLLLVMACLIVAGAKGLL
jgi:hypothetical protein